MHTQVLSRDLQSGTRLNKFSCLSPSGQTVDKKVYNKNAEKPSEPCATLLQRKKKKKRFLPVNRTQFEVKFQWFVK